MSRTIPGSALRVLAKALVLFVLANLLFAVIDPLPGLGRISAYNVLFPGRQRLPYGDDPTRAYNVSVLNLDAMFASQALNTGPKPAGEFRVLLIGDSSTWGWLLKPADTLAAQINRAGLRSSDGRVVRAYNLGYPIMSLAKDTLIVDRAMSYQPDLLVWLVTLESFPADKQLFHPLLQNNPGPERSLIARYGLKLDPNDPQFVNPSLWDRTIVGSRRNLADLLRLQLYGVLWAATGIDQDYPDHYEPAAIDLAADNSFHGLTPPTLRATDLAFDELQAGVQRIGKTPVLIVNEPILISNGKNSDIRYDYFYPRWAYDQYRVLLANQAQAGGWNYVDLWNLLPMQEFTNSAVHYTPAGAQMLAAQLLPRIAQLSRISAQ
ncbi:MAG TPA: hypothetical protein VGK81_00835 [Anaerolineae bacterium]